MGLCRDALLSVMVTQLRDTEEHSELEEASHADHWICLRCRNNIPQAHCSTCRSDEYSVLTSMLISQHSKPVNDTDRLRNLVRDFLGMTSNNKVGIE